MRCRGTRLPAPSWARTWGCPKPSWARAHGHRRSMSVPRGNRAPSPITVSHSHARRPTQPHFFVAATHSRSDRFHRRSHARQARPLSSSRPRTPGATAFVVAATHARRDRFHHRSHARQARPLFPAQENVSPACRQRAAKLRAATRSCATALVAITRIRARALSS